MDEKIALVSCSGLSPLGLVVRAATVELALDNENLVAACITEYSAQPNNCAPILDDAKIVSITGCCDACVSTILREDTVGLAWNTFSNCNLTSIVLPKSIQYINPNPYYNYYKHIKHVFYKGTLEDWNKVVNNGADKYIKTENVYFFSQQNPNTSGKFWFYDNGVPTIWE